MYCILVSKLPPQPSLWALSADATWRGRDPKREKRWKYERTGKKEESK
jgi:hypothetical protein